MTYCVGIDIAASGKGEGLDLAATPEPGNPYVIDQSHCLRCGICREVCPAQAILKL